MLQVKDLHAEIEGVAILKGLNLEVKPGEIHAIMGPNGAGKSTLAKVVAGHPDYKVTKGSIDLEVNFKKKNIIEMEPEERAREGVFLAFQYPVEVGGVPNAEFLRASFNAICRHQGVDELDPLEFDEFVRERVKFLEMDPSFLERQLNIDFSGGEKKRNEILQMAVLSPRIAFLDETDSGLDVDSLRLVAEGVNKLMSADKAVVMVTHYQRLLDYVVPDYVHILVDGKIVRTGDKNLALEVEKTGYEGII